MTTGLFAAVIGAGLVLVPAGAATAVPPPGPTVACDSSPSIFNTGIDADGTGVLDSGADDANWQGSQMYDATDPPGAVMLPPTDPTWTPAVVGNQAPGAWADSPFGNAQWISATGPTDTGDWYYRYQFDLDDSVTPAAFSLSLNFLSDNDAMEVWVNDVAQSSKTIGLPQAGAPNDPYQYGGYYLSNAASTVLNHDWQAGANTIIVQIKSGGGAEGFDVQARPGVVCPNPALSMTHAASPTFVASAGNTVTYSATLTNDGNLPFSGVGVTSTAFSGAGTAPTYTCPSSTLAIEASEICTANYTVVSGDLSASSITNSAQAQGTADGLNDPTVTDAIPTTVAVGIAPTAAAVTGSTLQNTPITMSIRPTVDPSTTPDLSSVNIMLGLSSWDTSLVVADEGTWTVTGGGALHFAPLPDFTGVSSPVAYRFADGYGNVSPPSSAQVTVLPVLPTATAVKASGTRGGTVSLTPQGVGPTVPLDPSSLRLIDPATGGPVSSLTLAQVGTFTVNGVTGKVDFVPLGGFVGTSTVIYRELDTLGRIAISTMTVTMKPITLTHPVSTVDLNTTARLTVAGGPAGSTYTVPGLASGATSLNVAGSRVTVVPRHNFSGRILVPVLVVHGTAKLSTSVVVFVRPAAVIHASHDLTVNGDTVARWTASPGAHSYVVRVNGVVKCTTSSLTCAIPMLLGPNAKVTVTALGHNGVAGSATAAAYHPGSRCIAVGAVHFGSDSAALGKTTRASLDRMTRLITAQGFTHGCLVGHTDNRGSAASNKTLSKHRVNAVGAYLKGRPHHVAYTKFFVGENDPSAPNNISSGRAANRSVEIGVG